MNRRSPVFGGTAASLFLIIVAAVAVVGCTENGIAAGAAGDPLGPEWGRGSSSSTAALNAGRVGRLLATTNNNPDPTGTILKVDPVTGAGTFVAELEDPTNALAYSTVEGVLYGSMLFGDAPPRSSRLVRIDPLTGAIDPVGLIRNRNDAAERFQVTAMGFDGANLFGFGPADELLDIDPATGLARVVGAAGFDL